MTIEEFVKQMNLSTECASTKPTIREALGLGLGAEVNIISSYHCDVCSVDESGNARFDSFAVLTDTQVGYLRTGSERDRQGDSLKVTWQCWSLEGLSVSVSLFAEPDPRWAKPVHRMETAISSRGGQQLMTLEASKEKVKVTELREFTEQLTAKLR
jgi:hypothetical protein